MRAWLAGAEQRLLALAVLAATLAAATSSTSTSSRRRSSPPRATARGSDDLWRPRVHFYFRDPATGVGFHSNDATGSYLDEASGRWHAFYDCTPPVGYAAGRPPGRYSWCEASSDSLVHWHQAPRAVLPEDAACDLENLETGAISRAPASGELLAIFSAGGNASHPPGAPEWEHVSVARGGCLPPAGGGGGSPTFRVANYTLIENANNGSGFRDPSRAIQLADGNHYVVIGTDAGYIPEGGARRHAVAAAAVAAAEGGQPNPGRGTSQQGQLAQASLWVNRDGSLLNWQPAGVLLSDPAAKFPECPDLFPLFPLASSSSEDGAETLPAAGQPYLLLASETYRRGTRWYMGTLQPNSNSSGGASGPPLGYRMVVQDDGPLDYGYGTKDMAYYAPRTMAPIRSPVGRGRRVLLGWIRANPGGRAACDPHCRAYAAHGTNWTFGDFAALPRELSLMPAALQDTEGDRGGGGGGGAGEAEKEAGRHRAGGTGRKSGGGLFAQRFVPELQALRKGAAAMMPGGDASTSGTAALEITLPAGQQQPRVEERVLGVQGRELEITVRATARGDGCAAARWSASISFLRSTGASGGGGGGGGGRADEEAVDDEVDDEADVGVGADVGVAAEASSLVIQHTPPGRRAGDSSVGNWTLLLDRSRSSSTSSGGGGWADRSNISAPLTRAGVGGGEGSSSLHAYVDRSIVECIADNLTAITARVFPQRGDSTSVKVSLRGEQQQLQRRRQRRQRRGTTNHATAAGVDPVAAATGGKGTGSEEEREDSGSCTITASFSVWALAAADHD